MSSSPSWRAPRRFLPPGVEVARLDLRAMVSVNVRGASERDSMGNRVAMLVARPPLEPRDPAERLARVVRETAALKRSHQAAGVQALEELSDHSFTTLAHVAAASRPFNLIVTNVPGPQFPVYGARMVACCSCRSTRTRRSASRCSATTGGSTGASTRTGTWCAICTTSSAR